MAESTVWIVAIFSVIFALLGGHILLTKVLPPLKKILSSVLKDENSVNSLVSILIVLVAVMVLGKVIEVLAVPGNATLNMLLVIQPGLDVIKDFGMYIGYLILGLVIVIGLKNWK